MTVKTFCSICDNEIGVISDKNIGKLTGKEICKGCGEYLVEVRADMEAEKTKLLSDLSDMSKKIKAAYGKTLGDLEKTQETCKQLYITREAELNNRLRSLL